MFLVVTTPSAPITIAAAMTPKKTFSATIIFGPTRCGRRNSGRGRSPVLRVRSAALRSPPRTPRASLFRFLGAELEGLGLGHGLHPLPEAVLVVEQVGDAGLGVLELGAPEERVERAHLYADPAVHAERVVDVEAVEHAHTAGTTALAARRPLLLVPFDVDAPVGALPRAQHAHGAVLFLQRD